MGCLTCTVEDYKGKNATVKVIVPDAKATLANGKILAAFLEDHSCAKVTGYGATVGYSDSVVSGKYDRVLQSLTTLFENSDGKSRRFSIPAPKDEAVDVDQEPSSDFAEDCKDMLVSIGALTSPTYMGGGMVSRTPNKEVRKKVLTGV